METSNTNLWCEHLKEKNDGTTYTTVTYDYGRCKTSVPFVVNFCPICGTPRPTKSKREELADKLIETGWKPSDDLETARRFCLKLSDVAIAFLESNNAK